MSGARVLRTGAMSLRAPLIVAVLAAALVGSAAHAQRRGAPAPVDVSLATDTSSPHRVTVTVVAREEVTVAEELRALRLEVRPAGTRRVVRCAAGAMPRLDGGAVQTLHAGDVWRETFDVRMLCWGRALSMLEGGGELGGTLALPRRAGARRGRAPTAPIPFVSVAAVSHPEPPAGDVRVSLAPTDALSGGRVAFRVTVRAARPVRAWLRPDRVRFRVVGPDGERHTCAMERAGEAPIPDLFARLSSRGGPVYSLDARAYCADGVFDEAGIYEVTPLLDLDVDGTEWRMDTPLGTFEGTPVPVRVRTRGGRT